MNPIAVFYHCVLFGGNRNINAHYAMGIIEGQMDLFRRSGLHDAASAFFVGVNGTEADAMAIKMICGKKAALTCHGRDASTEIPTMQMIRDWVPGHPSWNVLYFHPKGVSTPNRAIRWRKTMEHFLVEKWQDCVKILDSGKDACGCHWLTPEKYGSHIGSPFFGGTFWWATAKYLSRLPKLPPDLWKHRYEAEVWIGKGKPRPSVTDFKPGWPEGG